METAGCGHYSESRAFPCHGEPDEAVECRFSWQKTTQREEASLYAHRECFIGEGWWGQGGDGGGKKVGFLRNLFWGVGFQPSMGSSRWEASTSICNSFSDNEAAVPLWLRCFFNRGCC